jgi:hypothetical protein
MARENELSRRELLGAAVGAGAALAAAAPAEGQGAPAVYEHVIDCCDTTWHNPSCPGSANTWKQICVVGTGGKCRCQH